MSQTKHEAPIVLQIDELTSLVKVSGLASRRCSGHATVAHPDTGITPILKQCQRILAASRAKAHTLAHLSCQSARTGAGEPTSQVKLLEGRRFVMIDEQADGFGGHMIFGRP